jgi:hypothetical protein
MSEQKELTPLDDDQVAVHRSLWLRGSPFGQIGRHLLVPPYFGQKRLLVA